MTDAERLNWLEHMAHEEYGLLLHACMHPTGRTGLGLAMPQRTLRQAIDQAAEECDAKLLTEWCTNNG